MRPEYGETWVYESIIGALPGVDLSRGAAIAIQLAVFETAVLALAWYYAVLAFIALVTHLFVFDPGDGGSLVETLFGPEPPILVVYLTLLILWDLCYRIGTGWWTAVVALWRSGRYRFDANAVDTLRRADAETLGFAAVQLLLVPFVVDYPVLLAALVGHVLAVAVVVALSLTLLTLRER
jgi:hypothetical protein